jgi:Leucine-rich repeat (LRR) protein
MRTLNLQNNRLKELPNISRLSSLENLYLTNNQLTEVEGLESDSLRHVQLGANAIRSVSVSGVEQLSYLDLSSNPLQSLTFADNQTVRHLNLDRTGFANLALLSEISESLQYLDARENGISSINSLSSFTRLDGLYLEDNEIVSFGTTFDSMSGTSINLSRNPLLCSEVERFDDLPVNIYFEGQCATDTDGDGSVDGRDAFPDDVAASVDTDGDGAPDDWNSGFGAADSSTGLALDADDDGDGVADDADAFPKDASESQDSDSDGLGDNKDSFPNDPNQQYLSIESALAGLEGNNFQQCVREQTNGLSDAGEVYRLDCNHRNIESIGGILAFANLETLYLRDKRFCLLESLSGLVELQELDLSYGQSCISDIGPLAGLRKLEKLWLNGNQLSDLSPLANHQNLRFLEVGENQLKSLGSLGVLGRLNHLRAAGNELVNPNLSGFPALTWLKLDTNGIVDLVDLVQTISPDLEHISLDNNPILDLSPLTRFKSLKGIEAHDLRLDALKLVDMPALTDVSVYNNQIKQIELENVPLLFNLNLNNNGMSDLSSLGRFMSEQPDKNNWRFHVRLAGNDIRDITSLAAVERLAFVELQDNAIRDISALAAKTEIYHLDLNRNNISVLGNTFDDYQNNANVFLDGNTLLCSEVSNIGNSSANIQWNGDCGEDEDGDGVIDLDDAFPLDKQHR